jgi:hypothetical protein
MARRPAKPVRVHALKKKKYAKISWDPKSKAFVADLISSVQAATLASSAHAPVVVPIRNDPTHVILYLWDVSKNEYDQGETVSIDDPRLPGNRAKALNQSNLFR